MKKILIIIALLLAVGLVSAHEHNFNETKQLIDSEISCDELTDEQFEIIGEYYMEQMHPGESHDLMHKMMGMEEGTEYHKQFHVNMAKMVYCSESRMMGNGMMMGGNMMGSGGMMGMMPMMMNMMSGGMMGGQTPQTSMMQGMMGNWGYYGYWNVINVIYVILLIGLIVLVYLWIIKLWKNIKNK